MRPKSIITFEWLALLSLAVAIVVTILTWDGNVAAYGRSGYGPALLWFLTGIEWAIGLLLIFLISRKGNVIAKWIFGRPHGSWRPHVGDGDRGPPRRRLGGHCRDRKNGAAGSRHLLSFPRRREAMVPANR